MSRISDSESTVVCLRPEVGLRDFVSVRCVQAICVQQSRPPFSGSNSGPQAMDCRQMNLIPLGDDGKLPASVPKSTVPGYVLGKPSSSAVLCCCYCESRCYTVPSSRPAVFPVQPPGKKMSIQFP